MRRRLRLAVWAAALCLAACQNGEPLSHRHLLLSCGVHQQRCCAAAVTIPQQSLYFKQRLSSYPGAAFGTGACSEYARQLSLRIDSVAVPLTTSGNINTTAYAMTSYSNQAAGLGPDSGAALPLCCAHTGC